MFSKGETIPMFANELDSVSVQYPYDYYYLKFCTPDKNYEISHSEENLGSLLLGDRHDLTPYQVILSN